MNTKKPSELRQLALLYQGRAEGAEDMRQLLMTCAAKIPLSLREKAADMAERFGSKANELRAAADHAEDSRAQASALYH